MSTIEQVLDLDAMRARDRRPRRAGRRPRPVGRPGERDPRDRPALRAPGRGRPVHRAAAAGSTTSRSWSSSARRRATPTRSPTPSSSWRKIKKAVEALEVRTLLSGEYDAREALVTIRVRRRRRRRRRLRRDADADVHALGRAAQVPRRGLRHLLRRGGRPQVGDLRHPRAVRLRHALRRGRHPPPGADQPVRQPGPPPDQLRRRRGGAGARADRRDRHPRRGHPRRRLPLLAAPAASRSTPPTPRSGSPTSRPAPSSAARTRRASCRTRPAPWSCSRPSCSR